MSELTPQDVLADLFSDPDFAVAILDPKLPGGPSAFRSPCVNYDT